MFPDATPSAAPVASFDEIPASSLSTPPARKRKRQPPTDVTSLPRHRETPPPPLAPEPLIPGQWQEMWSVPIGATERAAGQYEYGQIVARGALVVVASAGQRGVSDAADGVYVVDGRSDADRETGPRLLRRIPSPQPADRTGATDAIGVALDGDYVVFATAAGAVRKARLDGRVVWDAGLPAGTRPGLPALVDLDGDGEREAIVPLIPKGACPGGQCAEWAHVAAALDGKTGRALWTLDEAAYRVPNDGHDPCDPPHFGIRALSDPGQGTWDLTAVCTQGVTSLAIRATGRAPMQNRAGGEAHPRLAAADRAGWPPGFSEFDLPNADALADPEQGALAVVSQPKGLAVFNVDDLFGFGTTMWTAQAAILSAPSIADVDLDGAWDVLAVADGSLHALKTPARGRLHLGFPAGDVAATGLVPSTDTTPDRYAATFEPRDKTRWLRHEVDPTDSTFETDADPAPAPSGSAATRPTGQVAPATPRTAPLDDARFAFEPADLRALDDATRATPDAQPPVSASTVCGMSYGLSEGRLIVDDGGSWRTVTGAPWPLVGLACDAGDVLRMKRVDGKVFGLPSPDRWRRWAYAVGLGVPLLGVLVWWQARRRLRDAGGQQGARLVVLTDAPQTRLDAAHPDQVRLVRGLVNVLDNGGTRPPVAIALFGPWGSGKSSVMKMLQQELKGTGRYIDVWFNAWRYQAEPRITPALLQNIVNEVRRRTDWATRVFLLWDRIRKARTRDILLVLGAGLCGAFAFAVCWRLALDSESSAASTGVVGSLGSLFLVLTGLWRHVSTPLTKVIALDPAKLLGSKDASDRIQFVRAFAEEFQQVSAQLPPDTRLIIYIDDLDRCHPDRVVDVLETVSMLADTGCAFFVMAFDLDVVRRSVELVYKDVIEVAAKEDPGEARLFGRRFIEKMVTLGVNVPRLPASDVDVDARTGAEEPHSVGQRLRDALLPDQSWLQALAVATIPLAVAAYGIHCAGGATKVIDQSAALLATRLTAASASASHDLPPASSSVASVPTPPSASAPARAPTAPVVQSSAAPSQRPLAPAPVPVEPPPEVTAAARTRPSAERALSDVLSFVIAGFGAVCALVLGALWAAGLARRQQLRSAPKMEEDRPAFKARLAKARTHLPDNPRNVVRFTNLSRFLYRVVDLPAKEGNGTTPGTGTADDGASALRDPVLIDVFFDVLEWRWVGGREPAASSLKTELDRWLLAARVDEAPGGSKAAETTDGAPPHQPAGPSPPGSAAAS